MRVLVLMICLAFSGVASDSSAASPAAHGAADRDLRVWKEFVAWLRAADLPSEKVVPYSETLREPMLGYLRTLRKDADWNEWSRTPEVFRVGDQVHFLMPLTYGGQTATYCLSFLTRDTTWFFQHLEAVTLRLDKLGPLPVTKFPDLPERDKVWMREELQVSRDIGWFNAQAAQNGRDAALGWFRDGAGYALAARAWVPFGSPARAFVLYACWEQANLRGSEVVLDSLEEDRAVIRLRPTWFRLYEQTAHLKQQIKLVDYRLLFESIWQDRAHSAGWDLRIAYADAECVFRLSRRGR